jgi:hypothetical protein
VHVIEERLGQVSAGGWATRLGERNPLVLEAVRDLVWETEFAQQALDAAQAFSWLLGLDRIAVPRIRLPVAALARDEVGLLGPEAVRQGIAGFALVDHMLSLVCQALVGSRLDGQPRSELERECVERALYLVAAMVRAQEEVEELERRGAEVRA